jgi:hypothetical protein
VVGAHSGECNRIVIPLRFELGAGRLGDARNRTGRAGGAWCGVMPIGLSGARGN